MIAMRSWIRRGLAALMLLAIGLAVLVFVGLQRAERKAQRHIAVTVQPVPLPTHAVALERGRYLYTSRGCADCHGANGGGRTFVRSGDSLHLAGANITRAANAATVNYQPIDWVRTLRHGVKPDGRALRVMPSEDYNRLTDADLGAIVAYVQSLPEAPGGAAVIELPLPARVLYGFGQIRDAADKIDHTLPPQQPVAEGVSVEHGQYVANMCLGCHGAKLEGGRIPGGPPDWPAAARLAPGEGSAMARYRNADAFLRMFKSGKTAEGRTLAVMPFEALSKLSDTDARALHLYLTSLDRTP
jgi:mono/diheme cytochrome c family protein